MDRRDVIARLREFEPELRARGVRHIALFGSVARGSAGPESDLDIFVDIEPDADLDVYSYVGLKTYIADLFTGPVDVVNRAALRVPLRPSAEADAEYAFQIENALLHIKENVLLCRQFTAGLGYDAFRDNMLVFYAVTRCLEIISEASRRLPEDMKLRHPDIPWREIAAAGNVYRHEYEDVLQRLVWKTTNERLDQLLEVVETELAKLNDV